MQFTVAVSGPARGVPTRTAGCAREIGREIAKSGAVLLTGGLGGVMAEASRGASEAGGLVIGLLPGEDATAANRWVGVALPTGLGEARNCLLVATAEALICVGGSWGALSEVALACRAGIPVVAMGEAWQILDSAGQPPRGGPLRVDDPGEAVRTVLSLARHNRSRGRVRAGAPG
ncbi:MAG: TIGR00725 family protein [Mycobacteriales bacterium]